MPEDNFLRFKNSTGEEPEELLIYGEIGEWYGDVSSKDFAEKMSAIKGKDLNVYINSGGGSVFTASAIVSQLKRHAGKVTVYVDGLAASAASFIAMAGDTVIMPSNSMQFIHNPLTFAFGYASDMRKTADDLDRIREALINAYQEKTNLEREKIIEIMDSETWLTADEAVELGFADEVAPERHIAASVNGTSMVLNGADIDLSKFNNIPTKFLQSAGVPAVENIDEPKKEESGPMDLEKLKAEHPEIYNQVLEEGKELGVKAERQRIKEIDELGVKANADLVVKAKYEAPINAGELAMAVLKAENAKGANYMNNAADDASELDDLGQQEPADTTQQQQKEDATANAIAAGISSIFGVKAKKGR